MVTIYATKPHFIGKVLDKGCRKIKSMERGAVRYLVLGLILIISACSTPVPHDDRADMTDVKERGIIADLTIQSAIENGIQDIRYAKYQMIPLATPFKSYRHVLLSNLDTTVFRVGLLDEQSNHVTWFDRISEQAELCILSYPISFETLYAKGSDLGDVEIQVADLPRDVVNSCAEASHLSGSYILMIDHDLYGVLIQNTAPIPERAYPTEFASLMISVLETDLMIHLDSLTRPSLAIVHQYLDERQLNGVTSSNPKRLRSEFRLQEMDGVSEKFFERAPVTGPNVTADPVQKSCVMVNILDSREQIYISFQQVSNHRKTLLNELCGVYMGRTGKLFRVESHSSSSIEL